MDSFSYYAPTDIEFGDDVLESRKALISGYGKRCYIITGRFVDGQENLALKDLTSLLDELRIAWIADESVVENPPVESVEKIVKSIREFSPDFMFAIGGGSALDTAKAANVLLGYPDNADAYAVFFGDKCEFQKGKGEGALPLYAIPTIAGNGAEVMGFAVLTRSDTHTKLGMNQMSFFDTAFLDPKYIRNSPRALLVNGALDALAHGVECYMNVSASRASRSLSDAGFGLFSEYKDALLNDCLRTEDYARLQLAGAVQGMACQQVPTTLPHGMGYPLSHTKGMYHGHASAITLGEYLRSFRLHENIEVAEHIIKRCGFASLDDFCDYIARLAGEDIDIRVTEAEIDEWSREVFGVEFRIKGHPEHVSLEDIKNIYRRSLRPYIV